MVSVFQFDEFIFRVVDSVKELFIHIIPACLIILSIDHKEWGFEVFSIIYQELLFFACNH
jgi:hypothetical protein